MRIIQKYYRLFIITASLILTVFCFFGGSCTEPESPPETSVIPNTWEDLGFAGSVSASYSALALDNTGTPYVIITNSSGGIPTVYKYSGGKAWASLGNPVKSEVENVSIVISNEGKPIIACYDSKNNGKIHVLKYDNGVNWIDLGFATANGANPHKLLVTPDNSVFLAYRDLKYGGYTRVSRFVGGTNWIVSDFLSSTDNSFFSLLSGKDSIPVLIYTISGNNKIFAYRYVKDSSWQYSGYTQTNNYSSSGDFALDSTGLPFFICYDTPDFKLKKLNPSGSPQDYGAISSDINTYHYKLLVTSDYTPFVKFTSDNKYLYTTINLKMWTGGQNWDNLGLNNFRAKSTFSDFVVGNDKKPYVLFCDPDTGQARVIKKK